MDYIEEKTPKGATIKIIKNKWKFIAFDQNGSFIYSDEDKMKMMHRIPLIVFVGENFRVENNYNKELSLLKVVKGELVIAYDYEGFEDRKYLFIDCGEKLDTMPVRLMGIKNLGHLVTVISSGHQPDSIVVDKTATRNDIIVIKNRCTTANVVLADISSGKTKIKRSSREDVGEVGDRRAADLAKEVDINIMSQNPVFLARVHLRNFDLSRMNQLLLDFDLTRIDTEYILSFINTMLGEVEEKEEIKREQSKLEFLKNSFQFYLYLLEKRDDEIKKMIEDVQKRDELASYRTLLAKLKQLFPLKDDQLMYTGYENLIWEMKEKFNISKGEG